MKTSIKGLLFVAAVTCAAAWAHGGEPVAEPTPVTTTWDFVAAEGWTEIDDTFTGETNVNGRIWTLTGCRVDPTGTGSGDVGCINLYTPGASFAVAPAFRGVVTQVTTIFRPYSSGSREATLLASINGGATFNVVTNYALPKKQNYENTVVFDPPLDGGDFGVIFCTSNSGTSGSVQLRRLMVEGTSTAPDEPGIYDYSPFGSTDAAQPNGALSGVVLYLDPGLGYAADAATNGWVTGAGLDRGVVADFGNLDQMNFFAQQAWKAGATIVPMRPLGYQKNEVVIDNVDTNASLASRVTFGGAWANAWDAPYYGRAGEVGYRWTYACSTGTTAWASYRPDIPVAGEYPVYAWAGAGSNRVEQLYRVRHAGGVTDVRVDHSKVGNGWVWLGNFWFESGTDGYVTIVNYAPGAEEGDVVVADAIRFGNGMGDIARGAAGVSGLERELESARYWIERQTLDSQGLPASVYDGDGDDRSDDALAPTRMAAHMCLTNDCPVWTHRVVSIGDMTADSTTLKSLRGREGHARDALANIVRDIAADRDGSPGLATLLPAAPIVVSVRNNGLGCATVFWKMPSEKNSIPHTGFRIYTSTDGYAFGRPVQIASAADEGSYTFSGLSAGNPYFFRVCAVNAGGESLSSPVAGVGLSDDGSTANVLVVDAFRRDDAGLTPTRRYDRIAGASGPVDVPLVRPRMINSFDYVKEHGNAIASAGRSFDSMDHTLVTARDLAGHPVAVWCLGRESVETETISYDEQRLLSAFLANHGALFISGAEIGRDLGLMGSASDREFLADRLSCSYVSDDVRTNVIVGKTGNYFSGLPPVEFNYTNVLDDVYAAGRAEAFNSLGEGFVGAVYDGADGSQGAFVACEYGKFRTVVMGFPFETVADAAQRNRLMKKILGFFEENTTPPTWIGDTAYTTGVGGEVAIDLKTQVTGYPSPAVTLVGSRDSRTDQEVDGSAYTVTEDGFIFKALAGCIGEGTYTFTFHASNGGGADIDQEVIISVGNTPIWQSVPEWLVDLDGEAVLNLYRYVSGDPTPDIVLDTVRTDADESTYEFDADEGLLFINRVSAPVTNVFAFSAANAYGDASVVFTNVIRRLDTDGDGIPDWWAKKYFGSPTDCNPNLDPDGDGYINIEEFLAGTSPTNRYSQTLPGYLENADGFVVTNYVDWAFLYGPDRDGTQEAPFLLNVSPAEASTCTGALLRVFAIATTPVGVRIELASDIPGYRFSQPEGDKQDIALGNGYVGLKTCTNIADFVDAGNMRTIPVPATIDPATGHAVLDMDFGMYLETLGSPPEYTLPIPGSLFTSPVLTPIRPDISDFLILFAEP